MLVHLSQNPQITEFLEKLQILESQKAQLLGGSSRTVVEFSKDLKKIQDEITSLMEAIHLQRFVDRLQTTGAAQEMLNQIHCKTKVRYRNKGIYAVSILFSGGHRFPIRVTYYARNCEKPGRGLYIALMLLGIEDNICPQVASMVGQLCVAMSSFDEAQKMLTQQGYHLSVKQIRSITKRFSQMARRGQNLISDIMIPSKGKAGRRIVISIDGGRLRVRTVKRGRKTSKGRSRYHTDWREPKIFVIYCIDEDGRRCKLTDSIIDGGVYGEPDALFTLLESYLERLALTTADSILFVADGAKWIWSRIEGLFDKFKVPQENIRYLLDFYHAVEHLKAITEAQKTLTPQQRKRWINRQKARLCAGKIVNFISELKMIQESTKDKELKAACEYFITNSNRLTYAIAKKKGWPIGSGAVESAVRRVINLRLKGAGIFWLRETANEMLFLRAYYKTNRWYLIEKMASHAILEGVA